MTLFEAVLYIAIPTALLTLSRTGKPLAAQEAPDYIEALEDYNQHILEQYAPEDVPEDVPETVPEIVKPVEKTARKPRASRKTA